MFVYLAIMLAAGLTFLVIGWRVFQGHTELIHSYHQERVKDKTGYGRAFGRVMMGMGASMMASGLICVMEESERTIRGSLALLIAGLAIGLICLIRVQKKYNGGMF